MPHNRRMNRHQDRKPARIAWADRRERESEWQGRRDRKEAREHAARLAHQQRQNDAREARREREREARAYAEEYVEAMEGQTVEPLDVDAHARSFARDWRLFDSCKHKGAEPGEFCEVCGVYCPVDDEDADEQEAHVLSFYDEE